MTTVKKLSDQVKKHQNWATTNISRILISVQTSAKPHIVKVAAQTLKTGGYQGYLDSQSLLFTLVFRKRKTTEN